jgi:hypothetical protein
MTATDQLTVHACPPAGVSSTTFSFERDGRVLGHAVRRTLDDGRVVWHVTDGEAPPFVVEPGPAVAPRSWLLTRPDGAPFARIDLTAEAPLELEVVDAEAHVVRLLPDGELVDPDGDVHLGTIDLTDAGPAVPDGVVLELPSGGDPALRAALLTIPLCLLPRP